jgi:hypothetical protein
VEWIQSFTTKRCGPKLEQVGRVDKLQMQIEDEHSLEGKEGSQGWIE